MDLPALEPCQLDGVVGDLRIWRDVELPGLARSADLSVWLPPGYDDSDGSGTAYPVVYLHDGHNIFDPATSTGGTTWRGDRAGAWLAEEGTPAILVAVPCSATRRAQEYTPYPHPELGGGEAAGYLGFLADHLKPAVDAALRTRPGPADTVVAGSSLGGVVSTYAWITRPEVFGGAGVFSPAYWWTGPALLADLERHLAEHPDRAGGRVYLDVGGHELPENPELEAAYVADAERVLGMLRAAGVPVHYTYDSAAYHVESAWARRLPAALSWLLGGYAAPAPPAGPG